MPSDVVEVSYTGDLLAHRRCPRSWVYEQHAGFHPYEQIQAMEGRLVHHAMEWSTSPIQGRKSVVNALEILTIAVIGLPFRSSHCITKESYPEETLASRNILPY